MNQLFLLSLWLTRRRLRQAWGLTAATSVGVLAAVVLLSATTLYSEVLSEAGVRYALYSQSPSSLDIQIISENRPLGAEDYEQLRRITVAAIDQHLGPIRTDMERFGRTEVGMPLTTTPDQRPPPVTTNSGQPFFMTGFADHALLVEGSWPQEPGKTGPGGVELQAVVGQQAAREMGFQVGDSVFITPFRSSPEERIVLTVVGLAAPADPQDEFWLGYPTQFSKQTVGNEVFAVPAYVTEDDFLQVIGGRFPTLIGNFGFNVFVDPSRITAQQAEATQESLINLETDLNKSYPRTFVLSRLGLTLDEYGRDLTLARVPVYVFISLVVIIILYFLVLIAGILGRSQAEEMGLLRSRGGSVIQVCGVVILANCLLAAAAVAVGPLTAWLIVRYAVLPGFSGLGGGPIEIGINGQMFWMGALGAAISLAVLALSAASRARTGVAESMASRSRPPAVSILQRYYIDVVAILAVGFVWWQFGERGGFLTRSLASSGLEMDPTVILAPVLGLLAAALLLLRILPLVVRLAVWICMRCGPAWLSFAMARVARDPVLPSSLAVLLMLSAAMGVFGATFQSSVSNSQRDQASYRIGGEVVIGGPGAREIQASDLAEIPGVSTATPVLRETVALTGGQLDFQAQLLAASPQDLAQAAWFREDFSSSTLPQLTDRIGSLSEEDPPGVPLPAGADRVAVWIETSFLSGVELEANINVWAKLRDAEGRFENVSVGSFSSIGDGDAGNWRLLAGDLSQRMANADTEWTVAAIFFTTSTFARISSGTVHLDDLTAFGPSLPAEGLVVDGFETTSRWRPIGLFKGVQDVASRGPEGARSGQSGLTFSWVEPFTGPQRGVHIPPVNLPIPAIGGNGLRLNQSLWIRHGQAAIPIRVVGEAGLFPSISNQNRPFVILDLNALQAYRETLPPVGPDDDPSQIWLSLDPSYERDAAMAGIESQLPALASVIDRTAVADGASRNPLAGGGWDGLTGLSIGAVVIAVGVASLLHGAASAGASRIDTAVAAALGLSTKQLFLTLLVERWLMAGAAIVAGAAIGYWPGQQLIQMLQVTPGGSAPLPPIIPQVHALLLALVLAGLAASAVGSALFSAAVARRERPAEALRSGG